MKRLLLRFTVWTLQRLGPARALRLLFRIDRWLYYFQGQLAIAYGRGEHPKHRHMRYHDFFVDRVRPGDRVLDLGCGIGAVAFDLAQRGGASVLGIDINPQNIERARQLYAHQHVEYRLGDVTLLKLERPFEVVILSNVLEHLSDRPAFLRQVITNANPSRALIRVPLFERDWRVPLKKELGVEWRLDPTHEIEYTMETFAGEMVSAGLEIVYQEVRWGEIWAELIPLAKAAVR